MPITYTAIDDSDFIATLMGAGVLQDYAQFLASISYPVRRGWTASVTDAVKTLIGRMRLSLTTYAYDYVTDFEM